MGNLKSFCFFFIISVLPKKGYTEKAMSPIFFIICTMSNTYSYTHFAGINQCIWFWAEAKIGL